jgi:hypothetical protein
LEGVDCVSSLADVLSGKHHRLDMRRMSVEQRPSPQEAQGNGVRGILEGYTGVSSTLRGFGQLDIKAPYFAGIASEMRSSRQPERYVKHVQQSHDMIAATIQRHGGSPAMIMMTQPTLCEAQESEQQPLAGAVPIYGCLSTSEPWLRAGQLAALTI